MYRQALVTTINVCKYVIMYLNYAIIHKCSVRVHFSAVRLFLRRTKNGIEARHFVNENELTSFTVQKRKAFTFYSRRFNS